MGAERQAGYERSWIEWLASAIGLALTLGLLGAIAWQALHPRDGPPTIEVVADRVTPLGGGYLVEFTARNAAARTAASVEVEGSVHGVGPRPVVSSVTLDYVPGGSQHSGGLYFPVDPRRGRLELRATGFSEP